MGDTTGGDAGGADAAPPVDHGQPSSTYPAFTPDVAQLANQAGPTLTAPKIVTVTWPGETNAEKYEALADGLGDTQYWTAITGEYGIGKSQSDASMHVHMQAAPPAQISDADLDTLVQVNASQTASGSVTPDKTKWPTPDANTLHVLYIPQSTKLMLQGQEACSARVGGYHDETSKGSYAYAIVPQCDFDGTPIADQTTQSASHEIAEATLDPHPNTKPGWVGVDDPHLGWDLFQQFQDENGDLCEFYKDSFYEQKEGTFDFWVQRQWSNKSAAAGHAPCVPAPADPYFNTTLLAPEKVTIDLSSFKESAQYATTGVHIPVGQTVSFDIGFYSDGPMQPWTIQGFDGNPVTAASSSTPPTKRFSNITIDKTTGENGEKAHVTVTVASAGRLKAELLTIVSSLDGQLCGKAGNPKGTCHYMPILIGSE